MGLSAGGGWSQRCFMQMMQFFLDGVRRWGSVEARFGNKFKDVWVGRICELKG